MPFETFQLAALAVVVFASTNIDDIFVLLGLFADAKVSARQIVAGQYLGVGALYMVSALASVVSLVLPTPYVGLLGLAPIWIGVRRFYDGISGHTQTKAVEKHGSATGVLGVAIITVANGGDNIGIYTPLFATRSSSEVVFIGVVFLFMIALWAAIAFWVVNHRIGAPVRRYGSMIAPLVFVALGVRILVDAGSVGLLVRV